MFYVSREKEVWKSKWEVWGSSWLHKRILENQERLRHYICYGSVMLELTLNCLANSCKTTFDSSIDEIPSILLELSFVS
jgi:hypothetical protein